MGHRIRDLTTLRGNSIGTEIGLGKAYLENTEIRKIIDKLELKPRLKPREEAILARYIHDMKLTMTEVERVLVPRGKAVFVVGENTVRGTYIRTATILTAIAKLIGLKLIRRRVRILPSNRRYLPPPNKLKGDRINWRMRREVIVSFRKPEERGTRTHA
jgi:hypothetical protein